MNNDLDLLKRVHKLENNVLAYKTNQPIGASSVRAFRTITNEEWDFEGTFLESEFGVTPSGYFMVWVRFNADNQSAPFATLRYFAEIGGEVYDYSLYGLGLFGSGERAAWVQDDWYAFTPEEISNPGIVRWQFRIEGPI